MSKTQIGSAVIELVQGDITLQEVDAIVNAANSRLAGGGGVDGAIHRRGGPDIMRETDERYPEGCSTGSAVITGGGNMADRHVIHAVGPVWSGGGRGEPELLASTYRRSLELAVEHSCKSLAFPALSAGGYGYPLDQAAEVALQTAAEFLKEKQQPGMVRFVLFDERALGAFEKVMESMRAEPSKR